jgi:hypothetical protein
MFYHFLKTGHFSVPIIPRETTQQRYEKRNLYHAHSIEIQNYLKGRNILYNYTNYQKYNKHNSMLIIILLCIFISSFYYA